MPEILCVDGEWFLVPDDETKLPVECADEADARSKLAAEQALVKAAGEASREN